MTDRLRGAPVARPSIASEQLSIEAAGVLVHFVGLAAELLPGAEHISVTLPTAEGWATAAATGPLARQVDQLQYQSGEGPCIAAARNGDVVLVTDLATETRWPQFTPQAAGHGGVRSMLSVPVITSAGVAGSLNASAAAVGAFPHAASRTGSALAALAGMVLTAAVESERAENRVAQLESVVGLLVHDLRSGTTIVRSAEDLVIRQRERLDQDGQVALELLGDELARQQRLLTDLVELVRAELPSTRAAPLLTQVQQALRDHRRPVPLQAGPGAAEAQVRMHPVRLRRILANLLNNADRHAGGATAVHVSSSTSEASVAVEDAGPGLPPERRERVFMHLAPSFPLEHDGGRFGLALCRMHARLAGGDVRVEDRPGGGSRFVLLLPIADLPAAADRGAAEA